MSANPRYEILKALPVYGPMYVPVTENDEPFFSEGFPVRFHESDGTNWVANFKPGWGSLFEVFDFPGHDKIVIFAGGITYVMTPNQTKPLLTFGSEINKVIQTDDGSLICADNDSIIVLDNHTGEFWRSERISWDGFQKLILTGDILHGYTYDPMNINDEWPGFTLNIKSKELTGGSYRNFIKASPAVSRIKLERENISTSWWKL